VSDAGSAPQSPRQVFQFSPASLFDLEQPGTSSLVYAAGGSIAMKLRNIVLHLPISTTALTSTLPVILADRLFGNERGASQMNTTSLEHHPRKIIT
jgi:hypothetical protein